MFPSAAVAAEVELAWRFDKGMKKKMKKKNKKKNKKKKVKEWRFYFR